MCLGRNEKEGDMKIKIKKGDKVRMIVNPYIAGVVEYIYEGIFEEEAVVVPEEKMEAKPRVITGTRFLRLVTASRQG